MKLPNTYKFTGFFIVVLNILIFLSCSKEPNQLALNQITNEKINYIVDSTSTVIAYSVRDDSVSTYRPSYNLLGSMMDPVFGKTSASIYSQFKFVAAYLDFGAAPVCDSIVLYLAYATGYYGDITLLPAAKEEEPKQKGTKQQEPQPKDTTQKSAPARTSPALPKEPASGNAARPLPPAVPSPAQNQ